MKFIKTSLSSSLLGLILAGQAFAVENRTALIIGLSTFADPSVPVLTGVPYDIQSAKKIALKMGIP